MNFRHALLELDRTEAKRTRAAPASQRLPALDDVSSGARTVTLS